MFKIANEEAPDIRVVRPELPERLAHVVALSLAKKPELRYEDGDQFAGDLKALLAQLSGTAAAPASPAGTAAAVSLAAATQAHATAEKTLVLAAATGPGAPPTPGYDAAHVPATGATAYDQTAVFSPSDAPGVQPDPKA
jgi:serine/threonine-protein kinase